MPTNERYSYWDFMAGSRYDFKNKKRCIRTKVAQMLNRCQSMLEFTGLPDTIPERNFKLLLQTNGFALGLNPEKTNGKPYVFFGGLGGRPDPYYMPTIATISNPALELSGNFEIGKDVVLIKHDSLMMGLLPILEKFCILLVENELTIRQAIINSRVPFVASANDERTLTGINDFFKALENGEISGIYEGPILEGILQGAQISMFPASTSGGNMTNLIEMEQYLIASMFNQIGVNANYNMKREAINSSESQLNDDGLQPLTDDIVKSIQTGLDEYNELFGMDVHVELSSIWKDRKIIQETEKETALMEQELVAAEIEQTENGEEEKPEEEKPEETEEKKYESDS